MPELLPKRMGCLSGMSTWTALVLIVFCPIARSQRASQLTTPTPLPAGSTLVIGFLGGYDRWDDEHRSVRELVLHLRHTPGVFAESISNHRRRLGLALIQRALDRNQDGRIDADEAAAARVILFGQSWGGAAALETARDLQKLGVPVLLTVQVDSVGRRDRVIPANVRVAANFYQRDPFTILHGRREIRAADPARTVIIGNFRRRYPGGSVDEANASWPRKTFGGSHVRMELDPAVWSEVERYISNAIAGREP